MHRFLRLTTLLTLASCGAACSNNAQIVAYVIAPDGGDPFLGVDAATQARVTLENDAGTQTTVPVMSNGSFTLDLHPASSIEVSRLRVEALRNGDVIATGVTTPVQWGASGNDAIPVLMQFRDSVVAAPQQLQEGRADCQLLVAGGYGEFVGCFTFPAAQNLPGMPAVFDVMHQLRANFSQTIPGDFTGDATVVLAGGKIYLLQGSAAVQYTGDPREPVAVDVRDYLQHNASGTSLREGLVRSSVYHSDDGGWLLGGNVAGVSSKRVDHFTSSTPDGGTSFIAFDLAMQQQLRVARTAPQIVELTRENANPRLLVAGGNASGEAFLELYRPMDQDVNRPLVLNNGVDTNRTHAAIACIHSNPDPSPHCDRVIVLGGRNGTTPGDDLLLDVEPVQHGGAGDPIVLQHGRWLVHPRDDAHLGLAEGGRLLVAGGDDANGAVRALEVLDIHDPNAAPTSLDLHADSCEHPMVAGVSNGSVIIMGGTLAGVPCTDISFYRH